MKNKEEKEGIDSEKNKSIGSILVFGMDKLEVTLLTLGVAGLAVILIANVIARTFFQSLYYADEISEFLITFITFVGMSYAARKARHIRMGAFLDAMPAKLEKAVLIVIFAISAVVMFELAWHSTKYLLLVKMLDQRTSALILPYYTFLVIVPIGLTFSGFQFIRSIIKNFKEDDVWQSADQKSEYEDEIVAVKKEVAE
ncbi:MAG: TRAP transporter small permease [Spirochaetota bacterium]|nr:TRAP transporter small permease [Spirochaetota bacterium]